MKKSVCLILCICLVLGASAPAFALPVTNVYLDNNRYDNYLAGSDGAWNYSESTTTNVTYPAGNTWAYAMLRQLYTVFKYTYSINANLESNSSYQTSNFGKAMYYFSTTSFQNQFDSFDTYLDLISTRIGTVNTNLLAYLPDIKSSVSSIAQHAGTISSMLGFTASNTLKSNIDTVISGISSSNTNTSNIKSVLDNIYYGLGYNSAGTLKTAINSIISNTSYLSDIKSNTDYLDDILSDTSSLITIENNTSAMKVNSDYLPGISTYASNLPDIKANTDYLDDIYNAVNSISIPQYDIESIPWIELKSNYLGVKTDLNGDYVYSGRVTGDSGLYFYYDLPIETAFIYKLRMPFGLYGAVNYDYLDFNISVFVNGRNYDLSDGIISYQTHRAYTDVYLSYPLTYQSLNSLSTVFHVTSNSTLEIKGSQYGSLFYLNESKSSFDIASYNNIFNIHSLLSNLNNIFSDPVSEAAKANNVNNQTTVLNNFTGSGAASATPTDFSDLTSGVASVKNGLNTGVSLSNLFGIFNNSDGYSWFSSQVLDEINTVQSSTRMRGSSTPLYDQKINEIYSYMGVNNND